MSQACIFWWGFVEETAFTHLLPRDEIKNDAPEAIAYINVDSATIKLVLCIDKCSVRGNVRRDYALRITLIESHCLIYLASMVNKLRKFVW